MPTIHQAFHAARSASSPGGSTVTKGELTQLVKNAKDDDGKIDRHTKALIGKEAKHSKLNKAATEEYSRLAAKYGFAKLADRLSSSGSSGSSGGSYVGGGSGFGVGGGS